MKQITSQRLADFFGVALSTVHDWTKKRGLPHNRTIGGQLRFDPLLVRDFLVEHHHRIPEPLAKLIEREQNGEPPPRLRSGPGLRRAQNFKGREPAEPADA